MFVTVTTTRNSPDLPLEFARIAGEEMLPWLSQIEGFEGLMMLYNETEGKTLVVSFWQSQEAADKHRVAREQFRDRVTSTVGVRVEDVTDYEVMFAKLSSVAETLAKAEGEG
jgi:heme-degrading monooxygenase HmoA